MSIRECPKDNQPLNSETRVIHHENPNTAYNRSHPHDPIIGGVYAPSDVEFLICPLCGWECESRKYYYEIGHYWAMQRMFSRFKGEGESSELEGNK